MRQSAADRLFNASCYIIVLAFTIFCLLPFWLMVAGSVTKESELIVNGYSLIPKQLSFVAYQVVLQSNTVLKSYGNTIFITAVGTVLALCVTSLLAYSLANKRNVYRGRMLAYVYFPMLFNGGLIPFYITVSKNLHLSNTMWAVILPLLCQPFYVFLMVSFFRTIPEELEESALMDGANEARVFFQIIVPVSKPILATVGLFYALIYWNDWFMGLLFIDENSKYPLQLLLRRMVSNLTAAKSLIPSNVSLAVEEPLLGVRMAATVITIGPIILLYPFLQKYFVKGLTVGAIKG